MTHDTLRELLHEVADEQPVVHVRADTFRRGRRRHRRAVVAGTAAALALAALAGTAVTAGLRHEPPPPASGDAAPAMPSHLYAVPERLVGNYESGPRWHDGVAAVGLAVGTTAAIIPVGLGSVMAVSARDGRYRGLELPGFDEAAYFRFEDVAVALSPDGNRLAYTWNPDVIGGAGHDGYEPSGVRVADLTTGDVTSYRIPGGYGVYAHGFSWSPDGRFLAYNLDVTTSPGGRVHGTRQFGMQRLDTRTGERLKITGIPRTDLGPAVSNRGEVTTVGNGPLRTWLPGRQPVVRPYEGNGGEWSAAWSPSGDRVAAGTWDRGRFSVGRPARAGLRTAEAPGAARRMPVRVLGWAGNRVALLTQTTDAGSEITLVEADVSRGRPARAIVRLDPRVEDSQMSIAVDLLDRPARDFPKPDWPTDWVPVLGWSGGALALLLAVGFGLWGRRRGRRRRRAPLPR